MLADSISPGAIKSEDEHRRDICVVGRWILERGFAASTDGNISLRLDARRILTSPTAISKGMMTADDLVITDMAGKKLNGRRNPSSELAMHLLVYRRRPDVNAICHAHPGVRLRSLGALWHARHPRADRSDRTASTALRRDSHG